MHVADPDEHVRAGRRRAEPDPGERLPGEDDGALLAAAERAAEAAGGWLLGARAMKLDAYLRSLREALDPDRVMNPGTLA